MRRTLVPTLLACGLAAGIVAGSAVSAEAARSVGDPYATFSSGVQTETGCTFTFAWEQWSDARKPADGWLLSTGTSESQVATTSGRQVSLVSPASTTQTTVEVEVPYGSQAWIGIASVTGKKVGPVLTYGRTCAA